MHLSRINTSLRDLQYADALAATLHFGEAAKRCHVSQSTLSIQIKKLEEALGTPLFERDAKTVRLSAAGEQLLPLIRQTLRSAADLVEQATQLNDPLAGTVRFGAFPTLAPYLLPHILPALGQALPKLKLELIEEKTETLLAQILDGSLDAALIALPVDHPRLDAIALFAEPFLLATPGAHKLAAKKAAAITDLQGENLLLLDDGHCLREQSLEFCARIGTGESQSYRATSLETLRYMVMAGHGITLMPQLAAHPGDGLAYLTLPDPQPQRAIALVFRSATARRVLFARMAREIRAAIRPLKRLKPLAASASERQH